MKYSNNEDNGADSFVTAVAAAVASSSFLSSRSLEHVHRTAFSFFSSFFGAVNTHSICLKQAAVFS